MTRYLLSVAFACAAVATVTLNLARAGVDAVAPLDVVAALPSTAVAAPPPDAALAVPNLGSAAVISPAPLPDPLASPAATADTLTTLWKSGAIGCFLILALYCAALFAGRWVPWLQGSKRRAAMTAASLALLATLVEPASRGTTPTMAMVLAGAATAIALFVKLDGDNPPPAEPTA